MRKPTIICLTPVKNEAWILKRFLDCTSLWADYIIVADQGSTDGSKEIARSNPKVILLENQSEKFNEPDRQALLVKAARSIPGPRILIALDADEMLTGSFSSSPEWSSVLEAEPGTVIWFKLANLLSPHQYYSWNAPLAFGFVDDGSDHSGPLIHSPRLPIPANAPAIFLNQIQVLHYSPIDRVRECRKLAWYQCWETVHHRKMSFVELYRMYHKTEYMPPSAVHPVPREWMEVYERAGIDMTSVRRSGSFWWDKDIVDMLREHGAEQFRRVDIWDSVNWSRVYESVYPENEKLYFRNPRSRIDNFILMWLRKTQPDFCIHSEVKYRWELYYRLVHKALRWFGW